MKKLVLVFFLLVTINIFSQENIRKFDLSSFRDSLLQKSDELKMIKNEKRLSEIIAKDALSAFLPQIGVEGSFSRYFDTEYLYTHYTDPETDLDVTEKYQISYRNNIYVNGVLDQSIFNLKNIFNLKAANENEKSAEYLSKENKNQFVAKAEKLFLNYVLLKKVCSIYEVFTENGKRIVENSRVRYKNDLITEIDYLESNIRYKEVVQQKLTFLRNLKLSYINLKQLLEIPQEDSVEFKYNWNDSTTRFENKSFDEVADGNLLLQSLKSDLTTRELAKKANYGEFLPTINARLLYNFGAYDNAWNFNKDKNSVWRADLVVSLPIFTGFQRTNQIEKSDIEVKNSKMVLNQAKKQVFAQLEEVNQKLYSLGLQIENAKMKLNLANKSLKLSESSLETGLISQIEFTEIFNKCKEANLDYYTSVIEYKKTIIEYKVLTAKE